MWGICRVLLQSTDDLKLFLSATFDQSRDVATPYLMVMVFAPDTLHKVGYALLPSRLVL